MKNNKNKWLLISSWIVKSLGFTEAECKFLTHSLPIFLFHFFFLFSKFSEIEKAEASEAYDNLYNICLAYIFWSTLAKPGQKHIFSEGVKLWVKWKNLDQYKMNVWFGLFILFFFSF